MVHTLCIERIHCRTPDAEGSRIRLAVPTVSCRTSDAFCLAGVLAAAPLSALQADQMCKFYLESGKVKADELVTHEFPLKAYRKALELMWSRQGIKTIILPPKN